MCLCVWIFVFVCVHVCVLHRIAPAFVVHMIRLTHERSICTPPVTSYISHTYDYTLASWQGISTTPKSGGILLYVVQYCLHEHVFLGKLTITAFTLTRKRLVTGYVPTTQVDRTAPTPYSFDYSSSRCCSVRNVLKIILMCCCTAACNGIENRGLSLFVLFVTNVPHSWSWSWERRTHSLADVSP